MSCATRVANNNLSNNLCGRFFSVSKEWVRSWSHVFLIVYYKMFSKKLLAVRPKMGREGKKSHTSEEGGAHLRISFSHLLMNFAKPEKSDFWKNEKNAGDIITLHMCTNNHNHIRYSSWDMDWDRIFYSGAFFAFLTPSPYQPRKPKFWKNEKSF